MTLGWKLAIIFVAFLAILTAVITVAFRERTRGKTLADDDRAGQEAQDARVMTVIFSAIIGGMLLTVLVGYIIFML
jgi:membrane protein implicated in regulation of membrane protease activity